MNLKFAVSVTLSICSTVYCWVSTALSQKILLTFVFPQAEALKEHGSAVRSCWRRSWFQVQVPPSSLESCPVRIWDKFVSRFWGYPCVLSSFPVSCSFSAALKALIFNLNSKKKKKADFCLSCVPGRCRTSEFLQGKSQTNVRLNQFYSFYSRSIYSLASTYFWSPSSVLK